MGTRDELETTADNSFTSFRAHSLLLRATNTAGANTKYRAHYVTLTKWIERQLLCSGDSNAAKYANGTRARTSV